MLGGKDIMVEMKDYGPMGSDIFFNLLLFIPTFLVFASGWPRIFGVFFAFFGWFSFAVYFESYRRLRRTLNDLPVETRKEFFGEG